MIPEHLEKTEEKVDDQIQEDQQNCYSVKALWSRHKKILRLLSTGQYSRTDIAESVGVTPQTVSNIANSALGKETLEILNGAADAESVDLMARFKALAPIALSIQQELMMEENTPKRLKNDIANKILDRSGYQPVSKNLNVSVNKELTREEISEIKDRAKEIKNVDYEEVESD